MPGLYPSIGLYPSSGLYPAAPPPPAPSGGGGGSQPVPSRVFTNTILALLDDLPPYEQQSYDIQGVLVALGNELDRIEAARLLLIDNYFPTSASTLLHFFELMLGLTPDSKFMLLSQRQTLVESFMAGIKIAGSGLEWETTIGLLLGSSWSYAEHDPFDGTSPAAYTITLSSPYLTPQAPPVGLTVTQNGAGQLAAGTYYYAVTAHTIAGETLACTPIPVTIAPSKSVDLAWTTALSPVTSWTVYRGPSPSTLGAISSVSVDEDWFGGFDLGEVPFGGTAVTVPTVDVLTNSFVDDGTYVTGGPPPNVDTSGSLLAAATTKLARGITPAHVEILAGYRSSFLVGISRIGIDDL